MSNKIIVLPLSLVVSQLALNLEFEINHTTNISGQSSSSQWKFKIKM